MGNKKIIIGIVAVIIVVGVFLFLNLGEPTELTEKVVEETSEVRNLIFVTSPWEPFIYPDEEGVAQGPVVETIDLVFSRLNIPYEIRFVPWSRALKELESGEADATVAGHTSERDEFLYYTEEEQSYPTWFEGNVSRDPSPSTFLTETDQVFFVRTSLKEAFDIESLEDIIEGGYRVGAVTDYSTTGKLQDAGINVIEYPSELDKFQALVDGEVDIVIEAKLPGFANLKKLGLVEEVEIIPRSFWSGPYYMPFSKASDYPNLLELREQVLDELRKIHESGEFDEIYNSYLE